MPSIPSQSTQSANVSVSQSSSEPVQPHVNDTGNHEGTSNTRGRTVSIDVNGQMPTIVERDGNLSEIQEVITATDQIILTLPDPGAGYEIRYTTSSKNPTHKSALYTSPITITSNLTGGDNTIFKFRIYSTTNHTIKGRVYKMNLRIT